MTRKHVVLIVLVLVCIGGLLSLLFLAHGSEESNTSKVETFCLTKYQWEIQTFSEDQNVGEVNDENVAIKNAKSLWLKNIILTSLKKKLKLLMTQEKNVGMFMVRYRLIILAVFCMPSCKKMVIFLLFGLTTN